MLLKIRALPARHAQSAFVIALMGLVACTGSSEKIEMGRAQQASSNKEYDKSYVHYQRIVEKNPRSEAGIKASFEGAKIAEYDLKRFNDAIALYKNVVLYSPDPALRVEAQKKIADLVFTQLSDYNQAVIEYSRLLELPRLPEEELEYRSILAKSYFYVGNFYQAQIEIDQVLKKAKKPQEIFDALFIKANILLTAKDFDGAVSALKEMFERDPQRAKSESIGIVLAVCYEEQKNFAKAIETLQAMKDYYPRKEFLERRIKTLRERQSYQPGAKGLHK